MSLPTHATGPVTTGTRSVPDVPAPIIVGAAGLASLVAGRLFAEGRIAMAIAIVLAASYVPLVFVDFPVALAVWAGMLFIAHLSALSVAPNAIGILLVVGWLAGGAMVAKSARLGVLREHQRLLAAIVLFTVWLGLSRIWTEDPGLSDIEVTYWGGPLVFVIVAMTVSCARHVQIIAVSLIVGAAVSVLVSLAGGNIASAGVATATAGNRLTGGGDPNIQAAGYVAAIFLAIGLLSVLQRRPARVALIAMMGVVTFGFFAAESRGGLIAFGVASLFALIVSPRHRGRILALLAATAAGLLVFLSSNPVAMHHLTQAGDGGSGRTDIWTVAWRVFEDHPILGAGLGSFLHISPRYVLEPGPLKNVRLIAESPHVVHNSYLQLLAENGIVGAAIFAFIIVASLRASWLAAKLFDAMGEHGQANLSRAVLTGTLGMLAAMFFISILSDFRLWLLFAMGPVLLTLAKRGHAKSRRAPGLPWARFRGRPQVV